MARARTLTLNTRVNVTGADKLRGLGRTLQQTGGLLTAGLTLPLVGFGAAMLTAAQDAERAQAKLTNVFDSMGAAAFTTVEALNAQAQAIQNATTFDDESITEAQAVLLTFGNVTGQAFTRAVEAATDMTALFEGDLQSAVIQVGKALNDPIKGVTALTRVGVSFTAQQLEQIKALQTSGDLLGAQTIILAELERQFGGTAEALAGTGSGKVTQALNQLGEAAEEFGEILAPVLVEAAKALKGFVRFIRDLNPQTKELILRVGGLAAAIGPVLIAVGTLTRALSFLGGPKLIGGIGGLGAAFRGLLGPIGLLLVAAEGLKVGIGSINEAIGGAPAALDRASQAWGKSAQEVAEAAKKISDETGRSIESVVVDLDKLSRAGLDWEESLKAANAGLSAIEWEKHRANVVESGKTWDLYQEQISGAMEESGALIEGGVAGMATDLGELPELGADELLANQFKLTDATTQLVEFMDQALSPAQEKWNARAFLASKAYRDGLASDTPSVVKKAEELAAAAQAVLDNPDFFGAGQGAGYSFGAGLVDPAVINFVANSAARLAAAARGIFPSSEPKDPNSPLRGITKGFGFGDIFARGLLSGSSAVQGAMRSLVGGGIGLPSLTPAMGGGGAGVVNNFYLRWDGEPPKGRSDEEIIGNLQRLSPLVGSLVGGT